MKEDIHIRVDEDLMNEVRAYAASHGVSLAAAVSVLLRQALKRQAATS
jgi:plasmid stability protein